LEGQLAKFIAIGFRAPMLLMDAVITK